MNSVLPFVTVNLSSHYYTSLLCLSWSKLVPESFLRTVPEEAGTDTRECLCWLLEDGEGSSSASPTSSKKMMVFFERRLFVTVNQSLI